MAARGGAGRKRDPRALLVRLAVVAGLVAAAVFAIEGGEYGTSDLLRQRTQRRQVERTIDSVQRVVDSLERYRQRLLTDTLLQERIAREQFGMVKGDKELLYWVTDTAADRGLRRRP
jgi:cell division protein FtsB